MEKDINRSEYHVIILSFIKFIFNVFFLYFLSKALNLDVPMEVLFWGAVIGQLAFLVAVTPDALGFLELGWFAVFMVAGMEKADIVYFVTSRRIFSILSTVATSGIFSSFIPALHPATTNTYANNIPITLNFFITILLSKLYILHFTVKKYVTCYYTT